MYLSNETVFQQSGLWLSKGTIPNLTLGINSMLITKSNFLCMGGYCGMVSGTSNTMSLIRLSIQISNITTAIK